MSPLLTPAQEWWTAREIADAALPDLPASRQGVEVIIDRLNWRGQVDFARRRTGKGGGWEYSWKLFPDRAKRKLLQVAAAGCEIAKSPVLQNRDEAWTWFDGLPAAVKDKAATRLGIVQQVEALERVQGSGRHMAVVSVAQISRIGTRTIWSWFQMIEGVRSDDRLPYLAPRNRAAPDRARTKEIDMDFFDLLKADYLRLEAPPLADCYRRVTKIAKSKGIAIPAERTVRRRMNMLVSEAVQILARKGSEALMRRFPAQVRDKTALVAMEAVNADFHKFDVFVLWPAPEGEEPKIMRPQMVAFQDIYSGRIVSWRLDQDPNSTAVLLAAGDMITDWGIPQHILLDNGREFAAKAITGGASTRYRFKVKEEDIPGLFTQLGCTIHWATPYHGQAKPIERAFRDMCSSIAKDPRLAGAYTGNRPDAKPENYGSKAIPLKDFLSVLAEGIEEHNTRQGRRSEVAWGRSFAEVFDESYATAPIRKATEAQRRLWLLGADRLTADKKTGAVWFHGNEFWAPWMGEIAGQPVVIRFDPEAFWDGVHIYAQGGAYLGLAPVRLKVGFFDADEARAHAKAKSEWKRTHKAAALAHRKYSATQIGRMMDELDAPVPTPSVESKVVKPTFGQPTGAKAAAARRASVSKDEGIEEVRAGIIADLDARRTAKPAAEEPSREKFRRALEIEKRLTAGGDVTPEQQRWLSVYQTSSEYRSEQALYEDFGDAIFG